MGCFFFFKCVQVRKVRESSDLDNIPPPCLQSKLSFPSTCHENPCFDELDWHVPSFGLRASPPCRVKGSWQALWRGLGEKSAPPFLPGLFKLPAPLTILPGERCSCCAHISGPRPLAIRWIVSLLRIKSTFGNIPDSFSGWRANMQGNGGGVPP